MSAEIYDDEVGALCKLSTETYRRTTLECPTLNVEELQPRWLRVFSRSLFVAEPEMSEIFVSLD